MSRESLVFILGFVVFITTFLGIPGDWKAYIGIGAGVLLMILGYSLRRTAFFRAMETVEGERRGDSFVESIKVEAVTGEEQEQV